METKEAIKYLRKLKQLIKKGEPIIYYDFAMTQDLLPEVIELLKRGEKYEAMWREISTMYKINCYGLGSVNPLEIIISLEQKYFPKPSDNFTEKVMEKINKEGEVQSNVDSKTNI